MANERVLLVDDEQEFVEVLAERLEARGLSVTTAHDGQAALEAVEQKRFDAIVLDLQMPKMDGLETLKEIMRRDPDAQVILLTGQGSVGKSVAAMKQGAVDFLEKPPNLADLQTRIGQAASKRLTLIEERSTEMIDDILRKRGW